MKNRVICLNLPLLKRRENLYYKALVKMSYLSRMVLSLSLNCRYKYIVGPINQPKGSHESQGSVLCLPERDANGHTQRRFATSAPQHNQSQN